MLKLPMHALKNSNLSYTNSCTSEYLGCHIFNMLGVEAQETLLGEYEYHGKVRTVVACKDFTSLSTTIIDFASNGYGTELSDIIDTIRRQIVIDPKVLEKHFWICLLLMLLLETGIGIMETRYFYIIRKTMK